jgi:hypothetical protein
MKHINMSIRTKLVRIALICIAILSFNSCEQKSKKITTHISYNLDIVDTAKVRLECELAIKNKDYKFLGIQGYGVDVPGVEREYIRYPRDSMHIRVIEGTSDFIVSEEQKKFQKLAESYAYQYNILLFNYLKTHGMLQTVR